jgi:type IV secretion system protein VirD4
MREEQKAMRWVISGGMIGLFLAILLLPIPYMAYQMQQAGFSKPTLQWAWRDYLGTYVQNSQSRAVWRQRNSTWIRDYRRANVMLLPPTYAIPFGAFALTFLVGVGLCPHRFTNTKEGSARIADEKDIKTMGLWDGWIVVLGRFKKRMIMLPETLSVLCVAPPGTGKTVGVVVPTILTCNKVSMIVNDVKPELADITSGYRQKHSICIRLEWAAEDNFETGVLYPRWNPLSPLAMPPPGPQRDLYIDTLVTILVPDPAGSADPHWSKKGRASLAGFIHFMASKCESGNFDGLPLQWQGEEASIPLLLDWITEAQLSAGEEIEKMKAVNPSAALFADPVRSFLMNAVNEARKYNYSPRAVMELTQLANTPDKERGSILSTMDSGMIIFKNSAVRARTVKSDFSFSDIRGMRDPETGEMKPVTIYICVNQQDSGALGVMTGLFVEALSMWLIAHKPGSYTRDNHQVGPFPVLFVLDEFPQMPKLKALIDGPAVGRGQKVSYLLIGQDLQQIATTYSDKEVETVISTTAAKIILPLNNEQTAERFGKMIGSYTKQDVSSSRNEGMAKDINPFAKNVSRSFKSEQLLGATDFMSMEKGTHYVLFQQYMKYPLQLTTPFYFKDPELKDLVNPANGGKYPPAPPMPKWMLKKRLIEEAQRQQRMETLKLALADTKSLEASATPAAAAAPPPAARSGTPAPSLRPGARPPSATTA